MVTTAQDERPPDPGRTPLRPAESPHRLTVPTAAHRGGPVPPGRKQATPAAVIIGFTAVALAVTLLVAQVKKPGARATQVLGAHTQRPTQTQRPTSTAQTTEVSDLLGYSLIVAETGSDLAVVPFSGSRRTVAGFSAAGYPEVPVRTGTDVVVVKDHTAFALTPPYVSFPSSIGPADHLFPAISAGAIGVWVEGAGSAGPTVQIEALPGTGAASSAIAAFPRGLRPLAELTSGILAWEGQGSTGSLRVWRPAVAEGTGTFARTIGLASAVLGTSGDKVAWLGAGCTSNGECPLHVTDAGTGADATVAPPPGFAGYLPGGAFSPTSDKLFGVYVFNPVQHADAARLVLVSLVAADTKRPRWTPALVPQGDVPLTLKGPSLPVVWTPDGTHVLFAGNSGRIHDYRLGQTASYPTEQPASPGFAVVREAAAPPSPTPP